MSTTFCAFHGVSSTDALANRQRDGSRKKNPTRSTPALMISPTKANRSRFSILSFTATAAIPSRAGVVPCLCPKSHRPRVPMTRRLPSIGVRSREPAGKVNPIRDEAPERGFVAMLDVARGVLHTTHNSCIGEPPVIYEGAFPRGCSVTCETFPVLGPSVDDRRRFKAGPRNPAGLPTTRTGVRSRTRG